MVLNVCYDCLDYQFNIMIHILFYCGGLFIHDCIINRFFFSVPKSLADMLMLLHICDAMGRIRLFLLKYYSEQMLLYLIYAKSLNRDK